MTEQYTRDGDTVAYHISDVEWEKVVEGIKQLEAGLLRPVLLTHEQIKALAIVAEYAGGKLFADEYPKSKQQAAYEVVKALLAQIAPPV